MLTQKQIDNAQIKIEKIIETKAEIAKDRFKDNIQNISNCYRVGQDGYISGSSTVYLKSGEIVNI